MKGISHDNGIGNISNILLCRGFFNFKHHGTKLRKFFKVYFLKLDLSHSLKHNLSKNLISSWILTCINELIGTSLNFLVPRTLSGSVPLPPLDKKQWPMGLAKNKQTKKTIIICPPTLSMAVSLFYFFWFSFYRKEFSLCVYLLSIAAITNCQKLSRFIISHSVGQKCRWTRLSLYSRSQVSQPRLGGKSATKVIQLLQNSVAGRYRSLSLLAVSQEPLPDVYSFSDFLSMFFIFKPAKAQWVLFPPQTDWPSPSAASVLPLCSQSFLLLMALVIRWNPRGYPG